MLISKISYSLRQGVDEIGWDETERFFILSIGGIAAGGWTTFCGGNAVADIGRIPGGGVTVVGGGFLF